MKKKTYLLFVLLTLFSLLVACAAPQSTPVTAPTQPTAAVEATATTAAPAPVSSGTLTVGIGSEPETLDPGDAVMVQEQFILISLFDSLLSMGPDATLHPGLALSWQPNADFSEFTFSLRQDVKFHDGTPFTAAAVKTSFDHINSDAVLESGGKTQLQDHQYKETTVVDDYTVTVKFGAPYPTFLRDAARQWLSISSPTALEKYGKDYGRNPVGTGPFKFVEWKAQSQVVLEVNPDYNWAPEFAAHQGPARLERLIFRFLPEAATRLTALQTGEVSMIWDPPAIDAANLSASGAAVLQTFAQPGIPAIMMINTEKEPTNDINVRKAMILAINQEELVKTAFQNLQTPAYSVLSPSTWSYDEQAAGLYRYNLDEARRLLDEAGWKDGNGDGIREKDGKKLSIDYPTSPTWEEAFNELLAGYLQKAGFEVTLRPMDDAGIVDELSKGAYSIMYIYWVRADPSPLRILFHSENINGGAAYARFKDDALDQALADGDIQTDEAKRRQDYVTAQRIIMENALILPMFTVNSVFLVSPKVENFSFDLEGYAWIYDIAVKP